MSRSLEHLLTLANQGRNAGSSGAEKQARAIVTVIVNNAVGLDGLASAGISELIDIVQKSPMEGRDTVKRIAAV
ncbi:hypothetical protein LF1_18660 [Rubripirellula obstinata]|uniref:Uncharacterized protein n=1 Tax=Rubripirellula obstinata TaxID=406547 RepID=A0A5B1CJ66_9BACT|nr:hypothetical protein [Rubripirellula obstinata]KAA1259334.1 hypothetical protein LF1_18660 [Rubripirellula obstinata]